MHPNAPTPGFSIAPSGQAFGKGLAYRASIFVPLIAAVVITQLNDDSNLSPGVIWTIVGIGVVVAVVAIAVMITRVSIVGPDIVIRRLVGLEKRVPLQSVTKTVLVQQYEQFGNSIAPTFAAVAGGSRPFLRLSGQVFDAAALSALTQALGRADVIAGPITPKMLEERHPGLLRFHERRPWTLAWIVVGAAVVVAIVIGVIVESS